MDNQVMTINLAKGHFNAIQGHEVLKADFNDIELPSRRYLLSVKNYESKIPGIAEAYETCLDAGMDQNEIIDNLIHLYFPLRFFHVGTYERMAIVLGFIGTRGSGKTCSAVMVAACDFLLRNKPVWSNVPINIRVVYRDAEKMFTSYPLDALDILDLSKDYGGGCVLYDEVNMEAAESTRFSSGANLQFSYAMQQIRKRMLSTIWTCQGWNWIDNRLRWQTDFVVSCRDASLEKKHYDTSGLGDRAIWRVHDLSGTSGKFDYDYELKHKYLTDYLINTMMVWLRPWWKAYETGKLQGQHNYIQDYKKSQELKKGQYEIVVTDSNNKEKTVDLRQSIEEYLFNKNGSPIDCRDLWTNFGVISRPLQTKIGKMISSLGYEKKGSSKYGYYWIKSVKMEA